MSGQESKCEVCDKVKESSARTEHPPEGRECDAPSDWWPTICLSHCQTRAQRIQVVYWRVARVFCVIRSTEATSPLYCGAHRNFSLLTSQQELLNGSIRVTIEENSDIIWTGMMCLRKGLAFLVGGCAYKSLARTERKQASATKLGIYSTYSTRSSIHFLARCSNFCKPLKKNIR